MTAAEFDRICEEVYAEDRADVIENGSAGGRNGYEQSVEIVARVAVAVGSES